MLQLISTVEKIRINRASSKRSMNLKQYYFSCLAATCSNLVRVKILYLFSECIDYVQVLFCYIK